MLACRVHPSLLLGVELPPVPAVDRSAVHSTPGAARARAPIVPPLADLDSWWAAARTAAGLGAGIVWFQGAPPGGHESCDACTIAAAAIDHVRDVHLGVVSSVPSERHPAVLAREVTALDVVSRGRAAARLRWLPPDGSSGLLDATEQLAEAVTVCGAVLRDESPVFEGRHFHIAGAVNRPPPLQTGGPPLFADAPAGPLVATDDGGWLGAWRMMLEAATAVVCPDDPAEVATWRSAIEQAATNARVGPPARQVPALVCRTTLYETSLRAGTATGGIGARLRGARDAGADGVVVSVGRPRRMGYAGGDAATTAIAHPSPSDLARVLSACFAPWVR